MKKLCNSLHPFKNIDEHGKQSSLEDYVKIIGTRPPIICHGSPIGQNIVIPNASHFRINRPYRDRKNYRQHNSSYYQPQPGVQNHRQQAFYKNDYYGYKGVARGMIHSGITTP